MWVFRANKYGPCGGAFFIAYCLTSKGDARNFRVEVYGERGERESIAVWG